MIYAEILAGGKGTRMGNTEMPKQFLKIGEKPIIIHTLETFLVNTKINKVIVQTPSQWIQHTNDFINKYIPKDMIEIIKVCAGGSDRNESIMNGIKFIESNYGIKEDDVIVTHDAVRPFLTHRIIEETDQGYITKGDNNNVNDADVLKEENIIGEVKFSIPKVGYVMNWLSNPKAIAIEMILLAVFIFSGREL